MAAPRRPRLAPARGAPADAVPRCSESCSALPVSPSPSSPRERAPLSPLRPSSNLLLASWLPTACFGQA
eukprot:5218187-Pyramimonas_sp.AAC.1